MSEEDGGEKEHEATQKKLDEARARGEVVRSAELAVTATYGGFLLAAAVFGAAGLKRLGTEGVAILDRADALSVLLLGGSSGLAGGLIVSAVAPLVSFFALPAALVLAVLIAQRALVFAPEKIAPRMSRISPLANAKQKFGRAGLFEFVKSMVKLVLVSVLLGIFLARQLPRIILTIGQEPGLVVAELMSLMMAFLFQALIVAAAIGAVDYLWQRQEHLRRNRMSRQELMDELKQSEGDPHVRGQRRRRAEEIATNRMLADVPKADVVIVNPTHYAVALRWDRMSRRAPVCVAKGTDEVAARIRAAAATAGVPIHSDPPTARALHANVEIGREIRREDYAPVAAAIRFAEQMRRRVRERRGR